jgi:hypothetical protein
LHDGFPVTHIMWRARHIFWVAAWLAARSDKQRQTLRFFRLWRSHLPRGADAIEKYFQKRRVARMPLASVLCRYATNG